jgi:hypothetical protein
MTRAAVLLNDTDFVRWPCAELCEWINEATRAIVLAKPSASSKTLIVKLAAGTRQTLNPYGLNPASTGTFTGGAYPLTLLNVLRNVTVALDSNGVVTTTAGGRMIKAVDRALLDAQDPNWHNKAILQQKREVRNFTFNETVPLEFFVYPGNDGTGYVEVEAGVLPQPIKAILPVPNPQGYKLTQPQSFNQQIGLPEPYSVPILDYVLYRCQMKDDIDGASGRAAVHYQQFATAIGMKVQVEQAHSPNAKR